MQPVWRSCADSPHGVADRRPDRTGRRLTGSNNWTAPVPSPATTDGRTRGPTSWYDRLLGLRQGADTTRPAWVGVSFSAPGGARWRQVAPGGARKSCMCHAVPLPHGVTRHKWLPELKRPLAGRRNRSPASVPTVRPGGMRCKRIRPSRGPGATAVSVRSVRRRGGVARRYGPARMGGDGGAQPRREYLHATALAHGGAGSLCLVSPAGQGAWREPSCAGRRGPGRCRHARPSGACALLRRGSRRGWGSGRATA